MSGKGGCVMRLKVEVTAEDIAKGQRQNPVACPVACALRRLGYPGAWFDGYDVGLETRGDQIRAPRAARDFAELFDAALSVAPFSFELTDEDGP